MRKLRPAGVLLSALLTVAGVCACGGASPATSATLDASLGATATATATANLVAVSPMPGTPDASSSTQISFLAGAGTQVSSVRVVGSRSGSHAGTLRAYSTGTGASFLPSHPFVPGEHVT